MKILEVPAARRFPINFWASGKRELREGAARLLPGKPWKDARLGSSRENMRPAPAPSRTVNVPGNVWWSVVLRAPRLPWLVLVLCCGQVGMGSVWRASARSAGMSACWYLLVATAHTRGI